MEEYKYSCYGIQYGSTCLAQNNASNNLSTEKLILDNYSAKSSVDCMAKLKNAVLTYFLFHRRRIKKTSCKTLILVLVIATLVYLQLSNGMFQRCFLERDFGSEFSYPQEINNFHEVVEHCLNNKGASKTLLPSPININYSNIAFLHSAESVSANESIGLLLLVKSATKNYRKRMAIRTTWGNAQYLRENLLAPELPTKVIFICGTLNGEYDTSDQLFFDEKQYRDIVLAQFHDSYENNTYKTMLAMKWAVESVKNFKYLMIVDDDMYVNLVNAVTFLQSIPTTHVQAVISADSGVTAFYPVNQMNKELCSSNVNVSLANNALIMGQLIVDAKPFRSSFGFGSKWSMSMNDYPFNYFPPYIAGGATLFDSNTVSRLYYGSFYTKHFWIDDVYLGIIAHKLGIVLTNNDFIDSSYREYFDVKLLTKFQDMIAMHGLQCPEQLMELWKTRDLKSLQNCNYLKGQYSVIDANIKIM